MTKSLTSNGKYTVQPTYYWSQNSLDDDSYFDTVEEAIEHYKKVWLTDSSAVIVQKVAELEDITQRNREVEVK